MTAANIQNSRESRKNVSAGISRTTMGCLLHAGAGGAIILISPGTGISYLIPHSVRARARARVCPHARVTRDARAGDRSTARRCLKEAYAVHRRLTACFYYTSGNVAPHSGSCQSRPSQKLFVGSISLFLSILCRCR